MNERVSIGRSMATMASPADIAIQLFRERRDHDPVLRARAAGMWIESAIGRLITERAGQLGQTGDPGPVGSIGKLFGAEHAVRVHELIVELLGADGMLYPRFGENGAPVEHMPQVAFLRSRANTIEGGTSEVMRNILAERVLGLPRDDSSPRDRPWKDIPRD